MSSSPKEKQKFLLPDLPFQANSSYLNTLKQRVLAHHYDKQIQKKQESTGKVTTATTKRSYQNPQNQQYYIPTYLQLNAMEIQQQRNKRKSLAKQYQQQISRKQSLEKLQKNKQKQLDKLLQDNLNNMDALLQQKKRKQYLIQKQEIERELMLANNRRKTQLQKKNKQKQMQHQRYDNLQRSYSLNNNLKLQKFKQYYDNVHHAQDQIQKIYINKWSPLIKQKQKQKQLITEGNIVKSALLLDQLIAKQKQKQRRAKNQIRQSLEQQIREKQMQKNQNRILIKNQSILSSSSFKNIHNPILNPVDFKMAHDNKLILKQLQKEQIYSGLARKGSETLLSNYMNV